MFELLFKQSFRLPSATYTESSPPIPPVPASDYRHHDVTKTIESLPHLFRIVTPINPDRFEKLLVNHPNKLLVTSFCDGLHHGFWPFADTKNLEFPNGVIMRSHGLPNLDKESIVFLRNQCDLEMKLGRYSESFGANLLPGMVAQPIFTVPKKGSMKSSRLKEALSSWITYPISGPISVPRCVITLGLNRYILASAPGDTHRPMLSH